MAAEREHVETLVIGGGQAGLSMGYQLSRRDLPYKIVDANPRIGDAWRNRWDSFRLFTPNRLNRLPGMPFPGFRWGFATKDEIVATLELVLDDAREMLRFAGQVKQEFLDGIAVTQDQAYIRALAVDFFISLLNTVEAWAQRTLDEIESWDDLRPDGKNERALEKFRELPVATPGSIETTPIPPRTQRQRHRRAGG
jgi:cation diffusion facilitator CzcD-associated flavoprotein CzcO